MKTVRGAGALLCVAVLLASCSSGPGSSVAPQNPALVSVPAHSTLVRYPTGDVVSPVTVTSSLPSDAPYSVWTRSGTQVSESWSTPESGTYLNHGYVVDAHQQISVARPAVLPPITLRDVTVGGHPAVLSTATAAPDGSAEVAGNQWISWRLGDGRYLHVWDSDGQQSLLHFAATFAERPSPLVRWVALGVAAPGLTQEQDVRDRRKDALGIAWASLCPADVVNRGSVSSDSAVVDSEKCFSASVLQGASAQQGAGSLAPLRVNGVTAYVGADRAQAGLQSGKLWVYLQTSYTTVKSDGTELGTLTPADLAATMCSAQLNTSIQSG